MFSESESEDDGGRVLILSGGPDFNFDYEDSTQLISERPYMADRGFNSLCKAVRNIVEKKNGKIVFDFDFLVQNLSSPDKSETEFFCHQFATFIKIM